MQFRFILALLFVLSRFDSNLTADEEFRERVAPIFASHCVDCHNNSEPKGDFSVEDAASFFENGYVEIGDAASSHVVELVTATASQPPEMPKNGPALTKDQVDAIKNWINSGAKWPSGFVVKNNKQINFDWWSFKEIQAPAVPQFSDVASKTWIRNSIDAFVLRKLRENQLSPSPVADRRTLIRRLSYDLTGLPPIADEIKEFENDPRPDAYEQLVDRYLGSPRYGERWARHWLDVVKYADTCGYDKDKLRQNAWPYRDFVIRSLNEDKPYKRFVEEQIAGDELYPDTPDGILGLGFIAAGPWDFIGHVEVAESKIDGLVARNLDRDDMVSNTLNTFCSVTIQCARCHDHKFDPFEQENYYGLQAVFAAVDRAERVYDADPELDAKRKSLQKRIVGLENQIAEIESKISAAGGQELKQLDNKIAKSAQIAKRPEFGYHSEIAAFAEVEKWVEVEFDEPQRFSQIILRPCHDDFADIGAGFGFPVRFRVEVDGKRVFDQTNDDFANPKLDPVTIPIMTTASKVRVVATKLAQRHKDYIFALAELQFIDETGNDIGQGATVNALDSIEMPVRWRKTNLVDGIWYESADQSLAELRQNRSDLVEGLVGKEIVDQQTGLSAELNSTKSELEKLPPGKMVYAAATSFRAEGNFKPTEGKPREIRLLIRGDVRTPGKVLAPGVLPLSENDNRTLELDEDATEGERRAALARWLTSHENPLTWRSIVNRVWHYHFGRGIVNTPNDFGRMGGTPSHPELLDWLAVRFRDGGGSLKDLHRLIVTSAAYRQTSNVTVGRIANPSDEETDAENRLLWKMNRRRLSAEEIRDSILMASGGLNLKMGGPGYYLFELESTEHSPHYEYHKFDHTEPNSYRRSIYRFIVRSQPDPYMTTLDCADSSQSTPARLETQTPLQSLTMLNSQFNLAMARKFADRVRDKADSIDTQIKLAMQLAVGRDPTLEEQRLMKDYVDQHGLENLARMIFNLSEFVYVD